MSVYQFKLPDIGEGIAEAEIVAWHVKVGDKVEEDQQLADMMTDKATVEMESPVAGIVKKLAGEVGDQIAIGSVLVEIETEQRSDAGGIASSDGAPQLPLRRKRSNSRWPMAPSRRPPNRKPAIPTMAVAKSPLPPAGGEEARSAEGDGLSKAAPPKETALPQALPRAGGERKSSLPPPFASAPGISVSTSRR
jgi:2-oxoisovalerate dehydrogenase E2 component (dihydrolipoyl transacylase)